MNGDLHRFIHCGRALCGDLVQAEHREWWLLNGLGSYTAGTVAGTLTRHSRRYATRKNRSTGQLFQDN